MRNFLFLFVLFPIFIFSQDPFLDTTSNVDSLKYIEYESQRNYLGLNITPIMSGVISNRNNHNLKLSAIYKRNYGYKNLRLSLNYLTEGSSPSYDFYIPVSTTDSSIYYRYFNSNYSYTDFRFGFEELRGYSGTRVHVGIDAIIGYGNQSSNYFHRLFSKDSSDNYRLQDTPNDPLVKTIGNRVTNYLVTGLDVSFGLDWIMNDAFMLTVQITPQFNYFIFLNESQLQDPSGEYIPFGDYADFKLGYFDLNLIYKF